MIRIFEQPRYGYRLVTWFLYSLFAVILGTTLLSAWMLAMLVLGHSWP